MIGRSERNYAFDRLGIPGAARLSRATIYEIAQQIDADYVVVGSYRSDGVLSAQVFGNFSRYGNIDALRRLYLPILDRLEGQPGVVSAAITNAVPLAGSAGLWRPGE